MKIIDFTFGLMPDSSQFCTDTVIYAFHETGIIEFRAYCMINSQAQPVDIEIEQTGDNSFICHVLTECELTAMSEKCIMLEGKLECREINQQLQMTVGERIIEGL